MKRIAVAMSGGVDSSVAALLLQEQGYEVTGVFINVNTPLVPCTAEKDRHDAFRACAALQIPCIEYDASEGYLQKVLTPFLNAYREGETPNPDVWCNTAVKFGVVYEFLKEKGYQRIATGHYAQLKQNNGTPQLCRARDREKDQTYFLYALPEETLKAIQFPVGGMKKEEVRRRAKRAHLPAAEKKDSTGLCFLGDIALKEFLEEQIGKKEGEVVDLASGEVIGVHDGFWFYTIGQRHGFTITGTAATPHKVVGKDTKTNTLFTAPCTNETPQGERTITIKEVVLREKKTENLCAQYRHRGECVPATLTETKEGTATVELEQPVLVAKGQALVLYTEQGICIGGGVVC